MTSCPVTETLAPVITPYIIGLTAVPANRTQHSKPHLNRIPNPPPPQPFFTSKGKQTLSGLKRQYERVQDVGVLLRNQNLLYRGKQFILLWCNILSSHRNVFIFTQRMHNVQKGSLGNN